MAVEEDLVEMLYHPVKVKSGLVIYLPTSIPDGLRKFVNTDHLIVDKELDSFKQRVGALFDRKQNDGE